LFRNKSWPWMCRKSWRGRLTKTSSVKYGTTTVPLAPCDLCRISFFLYESALQSFSLLTFWLCFFWGGERISMQKLLIKCRRFWPQHRWRWKWGIRHYLLIFLKCCYRLIIVIFPSLWNMARKTDLSLRNFNFVSITY